MSFKARTFIIVRSVASRFNKQEQQRQFSNSICCERRNRNKITVPLFNAIPTLPKSASSRNCGNRSESRLKHLKHSVAVSLGRPTPTPTTVYDRIRSSARRAQSSSSLTAQVKMPEAKHFERLPANVKPIHYSLTIKPDLKKCTFQGDVSIQIEVGFVSPAQTYAAYAFSFCIAIAR